MNGFPFNRVAITFMAAVVLIGCGSTSSSSDKYTLSEVMPDPVPLLLTSAQLGVIQFDLSAQPLSDSEADAFMAMLADGTISLMVTNQETGVSYNLTEGTLVEVAPAAPGEYGLFQEDDMVNVVFWNSFMGSAIHAGVDYAAAVTVQANDHFSTEDFTASVLVE